MQRKSLKREVPCPTCGYDLRTTVGRCPECGAEVKEGLAASRVPWVHRKQLGRVRAYAATVWMLVRRPGVMAKEADYRVEGRSAKKFHKVSLILGALIGTAVVGVAFSVGPQSLPRLREESDWMLPLFVLADSGWGLVPVFVGLWIALRIASALFRGILALGTKNRAVRSRLRRLGLYASGIIPMEMLLFGLFYLSSISRTWGYEWVERERRWMDMTTVLSFGAALVFFLVMANVFVAKTGRLKAWRSILIVVPYPLLVMASFAGSILVTVWAAGYTVLRAAVDMVARPVSAGNVNATDACAAKMLGA